MATGSTIRLTIAVGPQVHQPSTVTAARTMITMDIPISTTVGLRRIQTSKTSLQPLRTKITTMSIILRMESSLSPVQRTVSFEFGTLQPTLTSVLFWPIPVMEM